MIRCVRAPSEPFRNVNLIIKSASSAAIHQHPPQQGRRIIASNRLITSSTAYNRDTKKGFRLHCGSTTSLQLLSTRSRFLSTQTEQRFSTITAPVPPTDPNAAHTTLDSFLKYAIQTRLSPTSTTYLGTRYEYLTQTHLQKHLGFTLTRVGGRGDSGIDHLGTWDLPAIIQAQSQTQTQARSETSSTMSLPPIRVLVQCKRLARAAGPNLIRELEGSFRGAPSSWRGETVLGVMVCTRSATKGVRDAMGRSSRGLVWIMLEEVEHTTEKSGTSRKVSKDGEHTRGDGQVNRVNLEGQNKQHTDMVAHPGEDVSASYCVPGTRIRQFLYNAAAASKCGLEGVSVGLKYDGTGVEKEVQLLWQGRPIDFAVQHGV